MKDNEVKEKLESLSPLAGGVVYGKEEAWDRLQARMEKKPARTIPLLRLSAAAVLLLTAGMGAYYYTHHTTAPQAIPDSYVGTTATPGSTDTEQARTMVIPPEQAPGQAPIEIPEVIRCAQTEEPVVEQDAKDSIATLPAVAANVPTVTSPAPPAATQPIKKMRVVHINELGKAEEETPAYVYNGPSLDINKMKVVSLNDVQRQEHMRKQEDEIMTIVRINRPHGGFLNLTNTNGWGETSQRTIAQNPLSIRLNRNN